MMLYKLIPPSVVTATIQLPASKSISNRALIINALGKVFILLKTCPIATIHR